MKRRPPWPMAHNTSTTGPIRSSKARNAHVVYWPIVKPPFIGLGKATSHKRHGWAFMPAKVQWSKAQSATKFQQVCGRSRRGVILGPDGGCRTVWLTCPVSPPPPRATGLHAVNRGVVQQDDVKW